MGALNRKRASIVDRQNIEHNLNENVNKIVLRPFQCAVANVKNTY